MVLKSVGVLSAGKVSGALCALLGLLFGGIVALMSAAGVALQAGPERNAQAIPAIFVGVGAVIFIPLFYGIFGFITGVIYAVLYNVIAGMVGGLELEFERPAATFGGP